MAQQVKIAGALFNDVPYIQCPDVNDVYHSFFDTTIASNAATAADIASGKLAYVNGSLVTGTASGGGGTSIVMGHLRGDATLAKSWTYDKLIYADEGINIPSYTTTNTTLKSDSSLTSENLNFSDYSYLLLYRSLAMPIYSNSTISSGRQLYYAASSTHNIIYTPTSAFSHGGVTGNVSGSSQIYGAVGLSSFTRVVYCNSSTTCRMATTSNGAYMSTPSSPTIVLSSTSPYNTATLTVFSPTFYIRGNTTYLNSTNWGYITDIRYQYIYELWRVPASATVHGWEIESQFRHVLECANGNGTLT